MPDFNKIEATLPLGAFSTFDMACIYPALKEMEAWDLYLEVGVDKGKSLAFASTVSRGHVVGIDVLDNLDKKWFKGKDVRFAKLESNEAVKTWKAPIKVLFIDGDHSLKGVSDDWNNFSPFVVEGGWVFFHDADSGEIKKFVNALGLKKKIYKKPGFNTGMVSIRL